MRNTNSDWRAFLRFGACATLLLALLLTPAPTAAQWGGGDCPGDIGCTRCKGIVRPNMTPIIFCEIASANGGCACFTWEDGEDVYCDNWGTCIFTGWQGGEPPRV